jgi:hypothetical protein
MYERRRNHDVTNHTNLRFDGSEFNPEFLSLEVVPQKQIVGEIRMHRPLFLPFVVVSG